MPSLRSCLSAATLLLTSTLACAAEARWWKGNLHTHSLWSDGDDYPEMVADWYKKNGYNFLGLSDHNILPDHERWFDLKQAAAPGGQVNQRGGGPVLQKYRDRFGDDWVQQRQQNGVTQVRLKPLEEYRALLEEPQRFIMIPSMETSQGRKVGADGKVQGVSVHINITNPRELVKNSTSQDVVTVMQETVDAVLAQRAKTGQPMFPHVNHPNFQWGITPEELMQVRGEQFFEVYNGHAQVYNEGDSTHVSMDKLWDIVNTRRLTELKLPIMFGVGVDDSHNYHQFAGNRHNPGRGWVMVRAKFLTPESIIHAMEAGDFYASTGVVLSDVRREGNTLALTIAAEPGVTYRTLFVGTRRDFDPKHEPMPNAEDAKRGSKAHHRYSNDIGATLATVEGTSASYTFKGDEIYVRAKVISSKKKSNVGPPEEFEIAWTQPLVNDAK